MQRIVHLHCLTLLCGTLVCSGLGCSSLGFSTYPVAHFMTNQTKEVIDASPKRPQVPRELAKEVMPVHYLQPGDELLIEATNGESEFRLPADQQVATDGSLDLGNYGRIVVASLTLEDAEHLIYRTLAAAEKVDVSVNVRMIQPIHHYYVVGEVNSPGAYPLTGYETVLDGILAAGGLTSRASACDNLLARPTDPCSCRVTLPVCYRAITQLGDTTTNYQLKPGDRIFIGRQTFMEEFFPCCSKKTCERCCGRQVACCDPRVADRSVPDFVLPGINSITPPPAPQSLNDDELKVNGSLDDDALSPEINLKPRPGNGNGIEDQAVNQDSALDSTISPDDSQLREVQDGQLDFEFNLPSTDNPE